MLYLIVYERPPGRTISIAEYTDREAQERDRLQLELAYHRSGAKGIEVVMLEADSIEALKLTHGRYFFTLGEILAQQAAEFSKP